MTIPNPTPALTPIAASTLIFNTPIHYLCRLERVGRMSWTASQEKFLTFRGIRSCHNSDMWYPEWIVYSTFLSKWQTILSSGNWELKRIDRIWKAAMNTRASNFMPGFLVCERSTVSPWSKNTSCLKCRLFVKSGWSNFCFTFFFNNGITKITS
jgi:hypothetical protein